MEKSLKIVLGVAGGVVGLCVLCTCVGTVGDIFSDDKPTTVTTTSAPSYLPLLDPNSVSPVPVDSPSPSPSSIPVIVVPTTTKAAPPPPEPTEDDEADIQIGITPGAFCSHEGDKGRGKNGGIYTCKSSSTDSRNRWRK